MSEVYHVYKLQEEYQSQYFTGLLGEVRYINLYLHHFLSRFL